MSYLRKLSVSFAEKLSCLCHTVEQVFHLLLVSHFDNFRESPQRSLYREENWLKLLARLDFSSYINEIKSLHWTFRLSHCSNLVSSNRELDFAIFDSQSWKLKKYLQINFVDHSFCHYCLLELCVDFFPPEGVIQLSDGKLTRPFFSLPSIICVG